MTSELRIKELGDFILEDIAVRVRQPLPFDRNTAADACFAMAASCFKLLILHMPPAEATEWWARAADTMREAYKSNLQ